jgi:acyl carrier protein
VKARFVSGLPSTSANGRPIRPPITFRVEWIYERMDRIETMTAQERELAELIVETLNLEMPAAEIDPTAALYREGLGLDSIDILEIAMAVSKTYGFQLRSDDSDNVKIFSSLRSLSEHVQNSRTK